MHLKRWLLATVGTFAIIVLGDTMIHHVWLGEFYRAHPQWWRPEAQMQSMMGLMFASQALLAALLSFIYAKGYEPGKGDLVQGFRYGVIMGVLLGVPYNLVNFVVYPYPAFLILTWMGGTMLEITIAGMMIGYIYKRK